MSSSSLAQIYWAYNNFDNNVISFSNIKGITLKDLYLSHSDSYSSSITDCDSVLFTNCLIQTYLSFYNSSGVTIKNSYLKNVGTGFRDNANANKQLTLNMTNNILGDTLNPGGAYVNIYKGYYDNNFKVLIDNNILSQNYFVQADYSAGSSGATFSDTLIVSNNKSIYYNNNYTSNLGIYGGYPNDDYIVFKNNDLQGVSMQFYHCDSIISNRFVNIHNESYGVRLRNKGYFANNYIDVSSSGSGDVYGLNISQNNSPITVAHNSINHTAFAGSAMYVSTDISAGLKVKNNILYTSGGGIPLKAVTQSNVDWDYNCYYNNVGNTLASYNGNNYSSVSALGTVLGSDANSLNLNPFFISDTNLTINQALLQEGTLLASAPLDINGTSRTSPTTMGAKEFVFCSNDAGIISFITPSTPLSSNTNNIEVLLSNQGSNPLTSVSIAWSVNGVVQTPFTWTGNLASNNTTNVTIASNYTFSGASIYNLQTWVENPNGVADCNAYNDTIQLNNLVVSLCGTYTLGGTNPDFTSFSELSTILNNAGLTCPTTINVRDGVYDDQLIISNIPGNSFVNTLTIKGESGDSSLVTLEHANSATHLHVALNNVKGITQKDMTFDNNSYY
jgi:hypothetical protein